MSENEFDPLRVDLDHRPYIAYGQCGTYVVFQNAKPTVIATTDSPINLSSCLQ